MFTLVEAPEGSASSRPTNRPIQALDPAGQQHPTPGQLPDDILGEHEVDPDDGQVGDGEVVVGEVVDSPLDLLVLGVGPDRPALQRRGHVGQPRLGPESSITGERRGDDDLLIPGMY